MLRIYQTSIPLGQAVAHLIKFCLLQMATAPQVLRQSFSSGLCPESLKLELNPGPEAYKALFMSCSTLTEVPFGKPNGTPASDQQAPELFFVKSVLVFEPFWFRVLTIWCLKFNTVTALSSLY